MSETIYHYPNKMGRIILLGMEEVIGKGGLDAVLNIASMDDLVVSHSSAVNERTFSFETVSQLHLALERVYGPRGGRGLALRTGRSSFKYGIKEYGSILGLTEMAFRLLPLPTKLHTGARSFADLFNKQTDQQVRVEETNTQIFWHIDRCPLCWERTAEEPVCHLAVGLLQEALYWLSGGKVFSVEETACHARGDACCTITIQKTPLT
ncbi:MAG: 4-vinyl reductase [Anaerolineales bacterium]|jgi:predicted hydrocarbon binding protein|uniref:4-vinyl reductase n=1 Tax=Candidatus Villigracilis vicinus TaxID=3140679 RepID=UPI00313593E4|nr:4-vinyl reductase [Anaerolineales bacterium]MBK9780336.1 4-vinyl reductase [Anaerolineales bacterium]